jgi:hypothetical protein
MYNSLTWSMRVKIPAYAFNSKFFLVKRGIASDNIVTTDFNPLKRSYKKWQKSRRLGSYINRLAVGKAANTGIKLSCIILDVPTALIHCQVFATG